MKKLHEEGVVKIYIVLDLEADTRASMVLAPPGRHLRAIARWQPELKTACMRHERG